MKNLGTFDIKKAITMRAINKFVYGKDVKMKLYGRGKRVFSMDGRMCRFSHDLPLKYAKRAIVYRILHVEIDYEKEKKIERLLNEAIME